MFEQFGKIKNTKTPSYFIDREKPENESWVYVYDVIGAGRQIIEFDEVQYVKGYALLVDGHYLFLKNGNVLATAGIHAYALIFEKPEKVIDPSAQLLDNLEQFLDEIAQQFGQDLDFGAGELDKEIRGWIQEKRNVRI